MSLDPLVVQALHNTAAMMAGAKDRILMAYLTDKGLVDDYEEWVGVLNNDPERMLKLVLGE